MKPDDLLALFQELHADKRALHRRHEDGARVVSSYEINNAYQYVLNRENDHLSWLRSAIEEFDAEPGGPATPLPVPTAPRGGSAAAAVIEDDVRLSRAFLDRWAPRVAAVPRGRHRLMLDLLLGETREQLRSFEQAAAGRDDLLGRRPAGAGTGGGVMPTRWIE